MKKYKFFGVLFLGIVCLLFAPSVGAIDCGELENEETKSWSNYNQYIRENPNYKTTCGAFCTTNRAENKYKPNVVNDQVNHKINISVSDGVFNYKITGSLTKEGIVSAGNSVSFNYDPYEDLTCVVELTLAEDDNLCKKESNVGLGQDMSSGSVKYTYNFSYSSGVNSKVTNTNYDGVCKAFRNGTNYSDYFSTEFTEDEYRRYNYANVSAAGKAYYERNLAYCFSREVDTDFNQDFVVKMVSNVVNSWKLKNIGSITTPLTPLTSVYVSDTDMSSTPLKCDPFKVSTNAEGDAYYVNQNKYYTRKENDPVYADVNGDGVSEEVCRTTCQEEITVMYGPPVSSKAGLCFEYKVKVVSKVECNATVNESLEPTMPSYCEPYPVCNGYVGYTDQGGPNDDFDSCINTCDGGKYSQKCINKCYKKVYGSTGIKMALDYNDKYNVVNMNSGTCNNAKGDENSRWVDIYHEVKRNSSGSYKWNNDGSISWVPDSSCYWDKLGRYYFHNSSRAERTVLNLQGSDYTSPSGRVYPGKLGSRGQYGYEIKDGGFVAAENCSETCTWNVNGDSNSCQYLNSDEAIRESNERLQEYNNAVSQCIGNASCSTSTAEFTIKVNNKTNKNPNEDNWITYNKATLTGKNNKVDRDNIILDSGDCYGETDTEYDYMTEWSFPGTWINNKTGEVRYEPTTGTEWHKKEGKFCTLLDSADVNRKWWYWNEVDSKTGCINEGSYKQAIVDEVNRNQNIKATVRNFGYFSWDFDISCFYSLNSNSAERNRVTSDEVCPPPPPSSEDPPATVDNYKFRNVTTTELFPGEDGSTTDTGRDPGFNWSPLATNINNPDYEVTPTALIKAIQERQNDIYNKVNESQYLDYEFVLDRSTINKIRNYNKTDGKNNYTKYNGSTSIKNGVTVYKSNLFRYGGEIYNSNNKLGTLGCNNQVGNNCEKFTDDYVISLRGSR